MSTSERVTQCKAKIAYRDWVTSQSASAENLPENLISDVRRLVYSLKLNQASPHGAKDLLEVEMCRKLYWVAYDIDKFVMLSPQV